MATSARRTRLTDKRTGSGYAGCRLLKTLPLRVFSTNRLGEKTGKHSQILEI
ncbi:hypothetical protein B4100_1798 [Heyndrickxia coagulans]|nr:hypothetical protein B4100_1798 [Heyndrickxia coagulans]